MADTWTESRWQRGNPCTVRKIYIRFLEHVLCLGVTLDNCLRCNRLVTYKGTLIGHLNSMCACVLCVLYWDSKGDIVMEKAIAFAYHHDYCALLQNFCLAPRNFDIASKIFALSFKMFAFPQETWRSLSNLLPSLKKLYINLQNFNILCKQTKSFLVKCKTFASKLKSSKIQSHIFPSPCPLSFDCRLNVLHQPAFHDLWMHSKYCIFRDPA